MKNCDPVCHENDPKFSTVPRLKLSEKTEPGDTEFQYLFSINETQPIHTHTFFEFFFVLKGKGIHQINGQTTLLSEGSFVLIRPNDVHGYAFLNQYDMELINITFQISQFEKICRLLDVPQSRFLLPELCPQLELTGTDFEDVQEKLMMLGAMEPGARRKQCLLSVLPWFLYHFISGTSDTESTPLPGWLSDLIRQMEQPENFIEGLPRLIRLANLSQEHLTRSFRRYLHMSPTEFINLRRMEYAASLLLENRMEIIDVCQECGFRNLSYFYRTFQKQYGCSPGKFQEQNVPTR